MRSTSQRGSSRQRSRAKCWSGKATYGLVRDAVVVEPAPAVEARGRASRSPPGGCSACGRTYLPLRDPLPPRSSVASRELDELRQAFEADGAGAFVPARHDRRAARNRQVAPCAGGRPLVREERRASSSDAASRTARASPTCRSPRSCARSPEPTRSRRSRSSSTNVERGPIAARLIMGAIGANDEPGSPEETAWAFRRLFETLADCATSRGRRGRNPLGGADAARPARVRRSASRAALRSCCSVSRVRTSSTRGLPGRRPGRGRALVSLSPLSDDESDDLIEGLVHAEGVAPAAARTHRRRGRGQPAVRRADARHARRRSRRRSDTMPATIQALLAARIDRLEPVERAVLQRASVEGRLFHRGAVAELLPPSARTDWAAPSSPSRGRSWCDRIARSTRATTASASTTS